MQTLFAQQATVFARNVRIKGDEAQRAIDRVLHKVWQRLFTLSPECPQHFSAVIVVSRHHIDGHGQQRGQFLEQSVFFGAAAVGAISGHDYGVGRHGQIQQVAHRRGQRSGLVRPACIKVRIRQLCDQHGDIISAFMLSLHA